MPPAAVAYAAGALTWWTAASFAMLTLRWWTLPDWVSPGVPWEPAVAAAAFVLAGAALVMYGAGAAPRRLTAAAVALQAVTVAVVWSYLVDDGLPGLMRMVMGASATLLALAAVARPVSRPSAPR